MIEGSNSEKINYLENERLKLWQKLLELEKQIAEKPSDIEREAKQASKMTAEYRNRAKERLEDANLINSNLSEIKDEVGEKFSEIDELHTKSQEFSKDLMETGANLAHLINVISKVLEDHPEIEKEIEKLDELIVKAEENSSKATTTYKGILTKKTEIDELHREILGYEDEDEDGEQIIVEGIKDELKASFERLTEASEKLEKDIGNLETSSQSQYDNFIKKNQKDLACLIHKLKFKGKNDIFPVSIFDFLSILPMQ